jgi:hypothetical protein
VVSIIEMDHIIDYLQAAGAGSEGALQAMINYRERYGV